MAASKRAGMGEFAQGNHLAVTLILKIKMRLAFTNRIF